MSCINVSIHFSFIEIILLILLFLSLWILEFGLAFTYDNPKSGIL